MEHQKPFEKWLEKLPDMKADMEGLKDTLPVHEIRLSVQNEQQLFSQFDDSAYSCRQLNADVEQFCLKRLSDSKLPVRTVLRISIREPLNTADLDEVKAGIKNYFKSQAADTFAESRKTNMKWQLNFLAGLFFLALCLALAHLFKQPVFDSHSFFSVLSECLSIVGWVAIWEPAEYFLYSRKSDKKQTRDYIALFLADIDITDAKNS